MNDWLAETRVSYDTVAAGYADKVRDAIGGLRYERAALELFADSVRGGRVADVGCGPGHLTGYLHGLGIDAYGIDLSPGMIEIARREHPGLHFEVGSMTEFEVPEGSLAGIVAWHSLIHVPDDEVPGVFGRFHRALRVGGMLQLLFHVGDGVQVKTQGYGGHPMNVRVYRRRPDQVGAWLREAGFSVEAEMVFEPGSAAASGMVFGVRRDSA